MVHRKISEGQKSKPRGRPRKHGSRLENPENEVLASPGHRIGAKGGDIAPKEIKPAVGDSNALAVDSNALAVDSNEAAEPKGEESKPNLIDCIEIKEDGNIVKITLIKQKNRMIRLQMFFNGTEIRPSTFTGMSPAQNYWTLLKAKHKQK